MAKNFAAGFRTSRTLHAVPLNTLKFLKPLSNMGVRIRVTFGDIDPLNKVPSKRARSKVKKGPL